jgi:MFS family permease
MTAISFTLRLITTVHLINLRIPKQYTTTALTFVFNTLNGIMYILSNAISGVIYDAFGARQIYLVSAALCVIALGCALAARHISSEKLPVSAAASIIDKSANIICLIAKVGLILYQIK